MASLPNTYKAYTFDRAELELTDAEFNALNSIYDHLEAMKRGEGIVVKFGGIDRIIFLAPLSSNKDRLSNISVIHEDAAHKKLQLPDSDELLVLMMESDSHSDIVSIAKWLHLTRGKQIENWESFMSELREAQEGVDPITMEDVLGIVRAADNLEMLKYKLGVGDHVVLHGEKYPDSTYRGKLIERIICHAAGIVFIETSEGSFQFKVDDMKPLQDVSGDYILCELQFEPNINLQK